MQFPDFRIIDFHTHPFTDRETNICSHIDHCDMSPEKIVRDLKRSGASLICGSVIAKRSGPNDPSSDLDLINLSNEKMLLAKEILGDFYVPGFHVHPAYVKESLEIIEKMNARGIRLIGELVPYSHGWHDYDCEGFSEILDLAEEYGMIVSFHSIDNDRMDEMVKKHPKVTFVAAHPGEYKDFVRHIERMKLSENYYLDLSGYGIFRHGMLRAGIDQMGVERFIYGSDYPTCNPYMYVGGVLMDPLITDSEKEMLFAKNAEALLQRANISYKFT